MKTLKRILIIQLLLISLVSCAQNQKMKTEVEKIKDLGKDSIIQLAMDITSFRFEKSNFEKITISANHEDVYVSFINPVIYIPLNKEFTTGLSVSILGRTTSYNAISNPSDFHSKGERIYYNPNDKGNRKAIQFVFDAINKSKEVGNSLDSNTKGSPEEIIMTIKEKDTYYAILDASGTQESNYKIKKETGEIYDIVHYSLDIDPDAVDKKETVDLTNYFMNHINTKACVTNDVLKNAFEKIYDNIQNNSKPVHNGEMGSTTSGYSSKGIGFSHLKYVHKLEEVISIYDSNNAIRYYIFKKGKESFNMYYEKHFSPELFDEKRYKGIVAHFCKNIVNKDFKKSDIPVKITYQSLSEMSRDALINLAKNKVNKHLENLKEPPFDYTTIDKTSVLKNSVAFVVYFEQSFKYVPLHSAHYYGFYVNLLEDDISKLRRVNEDKDEVSSNYSYYTPSAEELKKIAFVKKAISYQSGQNITVEEKEKYFFLIYKTSSGIGWKKVAKKTGQVFDVTDRFYEIEKDPLLEVGAISNNKPIECPTQEDFKKGFAQLKKVILKKGKKKRVDGDKYPNYKYQDFVYRNVLEKNNPMEIITVSGNKESGFYWVIKQNEKYQIDAKDYPHKIALQKHKAALKHFCNHLLNFKE